MAFSDRGDQRQARKPFGFSTWAPKTLAMIGHAASDDPRPRDQRAHAPEDARRQGREARHAAFDVEAVRSDACAGPTTTRSAFKKRGNGA
jgi:hypothetical protein